MRNAFIKRINEIAAGDKNLYLMTGDLGYAVLDDFRKNFPGQFINAGIAEQNMTSVAAGMSMEGKIVFTYSIANFPILRCLEQIRNDCAYHNANVKIISIGGGFSYGPLGMTHHATEDLAIMRALPDVAVFAPGDPAEAAAMTDAMYAHKGTCYMRLGKGGEKQIHKENDIINPEKSCVFSRGTRVNILSAGGMLEEAVKTAEMLNNQGVSTGVVSFPRIKPIDSETIKELASSCELLVTAEEHNVIGGLGGAVAEILSEKKYKAVLLRAGIQDTYSSVVGSQQYLRDYYGLSAKKINDKIMIYIFGGTNA